ncbi:hypothetical protein SELMODRAFT_32269, partial [Selaginella moellendorffii]
RTSFVTLLRQCVSSKNLGHGRRLHEQIVDAGFGSDILLQNLLIRMYGSCGCLEEAKAVFDSIGQRGNAFSGTAMISAYVNHGKLPQAREIFDTMRQRTPASWTAMITANAQDRNIAEASSLFDQMPEKDLRDVVTWNTMLAAYAQAGHLDQARRLFQHIPAKNVVSWTTLLVALSHSGNLGGSKDLFDRMPSRDLIGWSAVIAVYSQNAQLATALELFLQMPDHRGVPAWNVIISGHAQSGHAKLGLELFHRMLLHGLDPNRITLTSVLAACCHTGNSKSVHAFFLSMTSDFDILPVYDHFLCMASHLGRSGLVTQAEELLCSMPFEPDAIGWITLLDACVRHKDVKRGERAADVATKLSPGRTAPYILLSNLYAAVGDWAGVARVRTTMKELGI